jgi:hypothetical protein
MLSGIPHRAVFICESLVALSLPASLQVIGISAFARCKSLPSIAISRGSLLQRIDRYAFEDCSVLKEFFLPKFVEQVHICAFQASDIRTVETDDGGEFLTFSDGFLLNK